MSQLSAYRVPPLHEFKAKRELREAGSRAYLPVETIKKRKQPVARGYIFTDHKPHDAKHVRGKVGSFDRVELIRLYPRRDRGHVLPDPFAPGDSVLVQRGPFAALNGTVIEKRGKRGWFVDVAIFGKLSRVTVATHYMRKHDPG